MDIQKVGTMVRALFEQEFVFLLVRGFPCFSAALGCLAVQVRNRHSSLESTQSTNEKIARGSTWESHSAYVLKVHTLKRRNLKFGVHLSQ